MIFSPVAITYQTKGTKQKKGLKKMMYIDDSQRIENELKNLVEVHCIECGVVEQVNKLNVDIDTLEHICKDCLNEIGLKVA